MVVQVHPALASGTSKPDSFATLVDFLLAFSPALILAPFWRYQLFRDRGSPVRKILISWLCLHRVVYLPFSLQRRFLLDSIFRW